jgi:hypothetical protein
VTTDTKNYAAAVVKVLREHFPDLNDPVVAAFVTDLIERHVRDPQAPFEVIVDDPISAKWRLHADNRDRRRVLLYIHRAHPSDADADLSRTVNDALRALENDR